MKKSACALFFFLLALAMPARGADVTASVGVSVSGAQILATQRLAPTVRATVDLVGVHGFTIGLRDELTLMPPLGGGDRRLSLHNRTTLTAGWAWESFTASVGAGLSQYEMSACSTTLCAFVSGFAPTADLSLAYYHSGLLKGALGVQVSGSGGWYFGDSRVLDGKPIAMVTIGPVYRFGSWFGGSR